MIIAPHRTEHDAPEYLRITSILANHPNTKMKRYKRKQTDKLYQSTNEILELMKTHKKNAICKMFAVSNETLNIFLDEVGYEL